MEPLLPPGYHLQFESNLLVLRRGSGKGEFVAAFNARGATDEAIEGAAWEDHREQGASLEVTESPLRGGRQRAPS